MGVDVVTYRCRVGTYMQSHLRTKLPCHRISLDNCKGIEITGCFAFIGLLLLMAGIEPNPGPRKVKINGKYCQVGDHNIMNIYASKHIDDCGQVMEDEDALFTETKGYRYARDILDEKHFVIITGYPGDGKTFTARRLLREKKQEGYNILILENFNTWECCVGSVQGKHIILIDNMFGSHCFDKNQAEKVLNLLEKWNGFLEEKHGHLKIVMTCRSLFYDKATHNDKRMENFKPNTVDLKSEKYCLSKEEKERMCDKYKRHKDIEIDDATLNNILEQSESLNGFPYYLELWTSSKRIRSNPDFFASPCMIQKSDIDTLCDEDHNLEHFFFFLFLKKEVYINNSERISNSDIRRTLRIFLCEGISPLTIQEVLKYSIEMEGIYVKMDEQSVIRFKHGLVEKAIARRIWEKYPREAISRLPLCVINEILYIGAPRAKCGEMDELSAEVPVIWHECVSQRIIKELKLGNIKDVFKHPLFCHQNKQFINCFLQEAGLFDRTTKDGYFIVQITERGPDVDVNFNGCVLFWVAYFGLEMLCQSILYESDAFIHLIKKDWLWVHMQTSGTLLHAYKNGFRIEIISRLLELGADFNCSLNHEKGRQIYNCDHCAIFDRYGQTVLNLPLDNEKIGDKLKHRYIKMKEKYITLLPQSEEMELSDMEKPSFEEDINPWDYQGEDTCEGDLFKTLSKIEDFSHYVPCHMRGIKHINDHDIYGNTMLHFILSKDCRNCQTEERVCKTKVSAFKQVLDLEPDLFATNCRHESPLKCLITQSEEETEAIVEVFFNCIRINGSLDQTSFLSSSAQTIPSRTEKCNFNEQNSDENTELHLACSCKNLSSRDRKSKVLQLIGNGHLVTVKNRAGHTPLHKLMRCACSGKRAIVELLLKDENLDVNSTDNDGKTALDLLSALETKEPKVQEDINSTVNVLIKRRARCNIFDPDAALPNNMKTLYCMLLQLDELGNCLSILQRCLSEPECLDSWKICILLCEKMHIPELRSLSDSFCPDEETLALMAGDGIISDNTTMYRYFSAVCKSAEAVKYLFRRASDMEIFPETGDSYMLFLLQQGVDKETVPIAEFLIQQGCNMDCRDHQGNGVLRYLISADGEEEYVLKILNLFIEDKINIICDKPLVTAAANKRKRTSVMRKLLEEGALVNDRDENALHVLLRCMKSNWCSKGNILLDIRLLLDYRIDVQQPNKDGETALLIALQNLKSSNTAVAIYESKVIHTILDYTTAKPMDPSSEYSPDRFALHYCISTCNFKVLETVRLLLAAGFDPQITDEHGRNALHYCCMRMTEQSLKVFLLLIADTDRKFDFNLKDEKGRTPLHYLCLCNEEDALRCMQLRVIMMRLLLLKGAALLVKDNEDEDVKDMIVSQIKECKRDPVTYDLKYYHILDLMVNLLSTYGLSFDDTDIAPLLGESYIESVNFKQRFDNMAITWRKRNKSESSTSSTS